MFPTRALATVVTQHHVRAAAKELREAVKRAPDAVRPELREMLERIAIRDDGLEVSLDSTTRPAVVVRTPAPREGST